MARTISVWLFWFLLRSHIHKWNSILSSDATHSAVIKNNWHNFKRLQNNCDNFFFSFFNFRWCCFRLRYLVEFTWTQTSIDFTHKQNSRSLTHTRARLQFEIDYAKPVECLCTDNNRLCFCVDDFVLSFQFDSSVTASQSDSKSRCLWMTNKRQSHGHAMQILIVQSTIDSVEKRMKKINKYLSRRNYQFRFIRNDIMCAFDRQLKRKMKIKRINCEANEENIVIKSLARLHDFHFFF